MIAETLTEFAERAGMSTLVDRARALFLADQIGPSDLSLDAQGPAHWNDYLRRAHAEAERGGPTEIGAWLKPAAAVVTEREYQIAFQVEGGSIDIRLHGAPARRIAEAVEVAPLETRASLLVAIDALASFLRDEFGA